MSQYVESGHRTFTADAAYARAIRMKLSGSTVDLVTVAGLTDKEIGILDAATTAAATIPGLRCSVHLRNAGGTKQYVANGAITANAVVYTAASGKVSSTNATGSNGIGNALTAATADGDIIEVLPF